MTTPRTIPENPKPGERFMRQFNTKRKRCWQVEVVQPDGSAALVNSYLSEADARLLVEGHATIDRLTAELTELRAAHASMDGIEVGRIPESEEPDTCVIGRNGVFFIRVVGTPDNGPAEPIARRIAAPLASTPE